jgi:hypothetical protein
VRVKLELEDERPTADGREGRSRSRRQLRKSEVRQNIGIGKKNATHEKV